MGKWLAAGALALVVLLIVLWRQLDAGAPAVAATPAPVVRAAPSQPIHSVTLPKQAAPVEAPEPEKPKKLDPAGDEFFYAFIEAIPKKLGMEAAECYEGKIGSRNRNAKMKLAFNVVVRNGDVTIRDIKVANDEDGKPVNTIGDPAIESCFFQKVARTTWHDDSLPDYEWPDELVIRPERGLKKFTKENREYVGAVAPKD
jgi:hypothetical protein